MADNEGLGRRMRDARRDLAKAADAEPLSFREIGELVASAMGREEPFRYQTVAQWFGGREPESFVATVEALASILKVDPGWLGFGGGPVLPAATGAQAQPSNGILVDVSSLEAVPDPDAGLSVVEDPPEAPRSLGGRRRRVDDNRPVQKKPPS